MTGPWTLPACRKLPPCCPRPADCSSPRSSHCDRCRSATGPPAPPSRLRDKEIHAHRLAAQSVTPRAPTAVWSRRRKQKDRTGFGFLERSCCLVHLQQTSRGIIWTEHPRGSSSLRRAHARLSLPSCGNKNNCLLGFHSPQRESVCDHVMSISTLKRAPPPSQFNVSGRGC